MRVCLKKKKIFQKEKTKGEKNSKSFFFLSSGHMRVRQSASSSPAAQSSDDDCVSVHSTRTGCTYLVEREEYGKLQGISEQAFQRSRLCKPPWVGSGKETDMGRCLGPAKFFKAGEAGQVECEMQMPTLPRPESPEFEEQGDHRQRISTMFWGTGEREAKLRAAFEVVIGCAALTLGAVRCDGARAAGCMQRELAEEYNKYATVARPRLHASML